FQPRLGTLAKPRCAMFSKVRLLHLLVAIAAFALLGAIGALWLFRSMNAKPAFTQEVSANIKSGMTEQEVEAIVGCPPGDYTTRPYDDPPTTHGCFLFSKSALWVSDSGMIRVTFNAHGIVSDVEFSSLHYEASWIDKFLDWLPW